MMDPDRWAKIERIYNAAQELEAGRREEYLVRACAGDESLRIEIETLLRSGSNAGDLMKSPALEFAARATADEPASEGQSSLAGRMLSHYRIRELIGRGGMGEVYRAEDTRLRREVAVKVLPAYFARDAERLARLEREACVLASLSHPNIAGIHSLEEAEGQRFLVMELVEGKTLAERLKKGPLPLDEALQVCCRIADGLEAAHAKGIVHRDLKPANVKIGPDGKVKILDFGLAKALQGSERAADSEAGSVITDEMTQPGVILGTAAYMSPEQATGKPADRRADIWAFGCILFECLTGRRTFQGETVSETLAAVIGAEPRWAALPHDAPEKVRDILNRSLRKDPERRLHDIADARIELEEYSIEASAPRREKKLLTLRTLAAAAIAVVAVSMATLVWLWIARSRSTTQVPLVAVPFFTEPGMVRHPAFSPDGSEVVFAWTGEQGENLDIYRKPIAGGLPRRLTADPKNETRPTWSPNGRFIAFFRALGPLGSGGNGVYLIPADGLADERKLAEVTLRYFPPDIEWTPDSRWLVVTFGSQQAQPAGLHLLSLDTGERRRLTTAPPNTVGDFLPAISPDGRTLAFVRIINYGICEVYRVSLTEDLRTKGEPERLRFKNKRIWDMSWTRDGKGLLYSSGYFIAGETVLQRIRFSGPKGENGYAATLESFGESAYDLAISRKDGRLMYSRFSQDTDIYRLELPGRDGRTGEPKEFIASKRPEYCAEYSPDGRRIAFVSTRSGTEEIWLCNPDGSNPRQLTFMGGAQTANPHWSPDGEWIVFDSRKEGSADLYLISVDGSGQRRLTSDPGHEGQARWSRDGEWIYYGCSRTGRSGLNKIPAAGGEAIEVTKSGGGYGFESPDGKWVYYSKSVGGKTAIWKVPVGGGEETQVHEGPLSYVYNYVVENEGIYFTKLDGALEFLNLATGKSKTLARLEGAGGVPALSSLGLTISPDRRWILYTRVEKPQTDLMLVENFR